MSRAARLFQLMQLLRRHRFPVAGADLANELGISLRTLYRDIAVLQAQGADIAGEAGVGYQLKPGFLLPPLMLAEEEIEALLLGTRWVAERTDSRLGAAAREAMAKIAAVLPADLKRDLDNPTLLLGPGDTIAAGDAELVTIRRAVRQEHKLHIDYLDLQGRPSSRTVWPIAVGFFDRVRTLIAWCELRQDLRTFRIDRIAALATTGERYPRRRATLLKEWRQREGRE